MSSIGTFIASNKRALTWVGIALLVVIVFTVLWKRGTFRNILPSGTTNDRNLSEAENARARALATKLRQDMKGINYSRNMAAWREFMGLNARMQVAVYNFFGEMYYSEGYGTMTDWVADESAWQDTQSIASHTQVLARLSELDLPVSDSSLGILRSSRMPVPQLQTSSTDR